MSTPSEPDPPSGAGASDPHAAHRAHWRAYARQRPEHVEVPRAGQVSVWNFPRPPRLEPVAQRVRVELAGEVVADTTAALRVCETASPPCYYIPPADVRLELIEPSPRTSFCEWKGVARYWTVRVGARAVRDAAWSYSEPDPGFEAIRDYLAFYAGRVDACWFGEHRVEPQPGRFYGGWITPDLVGPFKGAPGTEGW